jgi:hypothetical protein
MQGQSGDKSRDSQDSRTRAAMHDRMLTAMVKSKDKMEAFPTSEGHRLSQEKNGSMKKLVALRIRDQIFLRRRRSGRAKLYYRFRRR